MFCMSRVCIRALDMVCRAAVCIQSVTNDEVFRTVLAGSRTQLQL